jgi:hypothetical protein
MDFLVKIPVVNFILQLQFRFAGSIFVLQVYRLMLQDFLGTVSDKEVAEKERSRIESRAKVLDRIGQKAGDRV